MIETRRIQFAPAAALLVLLCGAPPAEGDRLSLRNGETIEGVMIGADARYIKLLDVTGTPRSYLRSDVAGIEITAEPPPSLATRFSSDTPKRAIPAGTALVVRTIDRIDSGGAATGGRFSASIDEPVTLDGNVVIPKGSPASLEVAAVEHAGALKGQEALSLRLREIRVSDESRAVGSSYARFASGSKGRRSFVRTITLTTAGAVIGALAGGGVGALIGGGIGGAAGVAVSAAGRGRVKVEPETRLVFTLRRPVPLDDDQVAPRTDDEEVAPGTDDEEEVRP